MAQRRAGKAVGNGNRVDRAADQHRGQGHAAADQRGRIVDRKRGRAARQPAARDADSSRLIRRREGAADDSLRHVLLDGQDIDYRLIRARRQSIGMTIDHTGLVVRAPRWVSIREIELALKERARWVIAMLAEWRGRNRDSLPSAWQEGAPLLFQGRALTLALFPARRQAIAADLLNLRSEE